MNKSQMFNRDCTENCKSTVHGDLINAAITKRGVSDEELCSYLNYICTNCESIRDSLGRTALHMACSCGRLGLVRWLIKLGNFHINAKDGESGYTPLHRSLFYGKIDIAVELAKSGANFLIYDMDNLTALEHVMKDENLSHNLTNKCFGSLYTWGLNNNNSLGSFNSRSTPESLDIFHKKFPKAMVQNICIDRFHCLILTVSGEVYSCGHGLGGRLGQGTEKTVIVPSKIEFQSSEKVTISKISISRDHCLFLSSENLLFSCGLNNNKVLGLSPPPEKALSPQKIKQTCNKTIEGISVGLYHSAFWTSTVLYTWGFNVGQLGHEPLNGNYFIINPKQVKVINAENSAIRQVASSDGAIAVVTERGDIYILHEYQCRKIASRLLDIADIAIIGGKLNIQQEKDVKVEPNKELRVIVRTHVGNLFLWQESDQQLCRCIFSIPRAIIVKQVMININEILFITNFGEAFRAVIKPRKKKTIIEKKTAFHNFLVKNECVTLKLTKIPRIHRGVYITSDPKGEDFCVIQQNPHNDEIFLADPMEFNMEDQLALLLSEANEDDNIHDISFIVGNKVFPSHRYILAHRSEEFKDICGDGKEEITLKDVNADFFEEMLSFIYTGSCDLMNVGKCPERFKKYCINVKEENVNPEVGKKKKNSVNAIRMLQELAKRFGCTQLYKILVDYNMEGLLVKKRNSTIVDTQIVYNLTDFPEFQDVIIKCSDKKEVKAHRCMLAARLDYFRSMFSVRWDMVEKIETISIPHPHNLVEAFLEYLYTDSVKFLMKKECDFLLKLLVLADEYLVNDLKNHCASILTSNFLDLKNAVEILQFAHYYKANSLKQAVMKYIVNNMAYFLETHALDDVSDEILKDLSRKYSDERTQICCRVITPYSCAASDEVIAEIHGTYPTDTETPESKNKVNASKYPRRRLRTPKKPSEGETGNPDSLIQFPIESIDSLETSMDSFSLRSPQSSTVVGSVQKRLSAISSAMEIIETEDYVPNFRNLNESDDFPELSSSRDGSFCGVNSPPNHRRISGKSEGNKHKMVRISQKERKRLSSESGKEPTPVVPESPKNPWKIIAPEHSSPIVSPSETFCDILSNEKKQKENFVKMTNKLLIHTQMEDKAILELEKFYCVENIEDEIIIVQRIATKNVALPIWVPKSQGHS